MKTVTKASKGLVIELFCEPEDMRIEGNASAIDPETDAETIAWIKAELDRGNEWAWCCAHVRVTYKGIIKADDYLGGCSYKSEADFRAVESDGGYFDGMVETCIDEINAKLAQLCAESVTL
jgi:hypothetical protein